MSTNLTTQDCHGNTVRQGSIVRVLSIAESLLMPLDASERQALSSMVNQTFEVYEVDEWGQAWVEK